MLEKIKQLLGKRVRKSFETITFDDEVIEKNNLIFMMQSGYREGHTCKTVYMCKFRKGLNYNNLAV